MKKVTILFLFLSYFTFGQTNNVSKLSLQEIMKGNEFIGHQPENPRWSVDGKYLFFDWNKENNPRNSTYIYSLDAKSYQKVTKTTLQTIFPDDRAQHGHAVYYYIIDNALIRYHLSSKKATVVYQTSSPIHSLQRVASNENGYFLSNNNLFVFDDTEKSVRQITNFIAKNKPDGKHDSTFLEKQQTELFQFIREKNKRANWREKNEITTFTFPQETYLGTDPIESIQITQNGKFVVYRTVSIPDEQETQFDQFITSNGAVKTIKARPKVSNKETNYQLGIYDIERDTNYTLDLWSLSYIRTMPKYLQKDPNKIAEYDKDRALAIHRVIESKDGKFSVVDIRSCDNKDRWIVQIDLKTGKFQEVEHQHDDAWMGGPGISEWNSEEAVLGFLADNQTIYFQSEETGFSHLYTLNLKTKVKTALTSGKWEVLQVLLSADGTKFFLTTNQTHPGNQNYFQLSIATKTLVPILTKDGAHEVELSPNQSMLCVRYSYKNVPWELYLAKNEKNANMVAITSSQTEAFKGYAWKNPEVFPMKGSDGNEFYARLYQPKTETKNNATIMFVHGAGYLQNAHNYWSYYCREFMFHNLLVDNGYTVIDIDYRASAGYGRDYRTAIYQNMGGRDLADYVDAKKFLVDKYQLDSTKFGIYGGSYGGFMTLMGMLKTPGTFKCGAALRSVTDWAHYNNDYTSNILNYPETDPKAYERSSPIYYANNLKGRLLLLHGMLDDNVQYQDVVRLSQRFIELGKTNWELALFPVEAHGFKETYSWVDEYRRIYEMFEAELR